MEANDRRKKILLKRQISCFLLFAASICIFGYYSFNKVNNTALVTNDNVKIASLESFQESFQSLPRSLQEVSNKCSTEYGDFCLSVDNRNICEEILPHTCCKADVNRGNDTYCITEHDKEVCRRRDICPTEFVPGGSGSGECFAEWEKKRGASITIYLLIILYLFLALAIVCDDYFVPSLEKISESLSLSEDVAGATFMAAGSSAPELFVSFADNVLSNPPKNLGTGTIVGSAIFNILVIIGLSALLAGQDLALDWRPLLRDSLFYIASIVLLVIVVSNEEATWYEGLILFCVYLLYVVFMRFNTPFFAKLDDFLEKKGFIKPIKPSLETRESKVTFEDFKSLDDKTAAESPAVEANGDVELALGDKKSEEELKEDKKTEFAENAKLRHTLETDRPTEKMMQTLETANLSRRRRESVPSAPARPRVNRLESAKFASGTGATSSMNPLLLSKNRGGWKQLKEESYAGLFPMDGDESPMSMDKVAAKIMAVQKSKRIWMKKVEEGRERRALDEAAEKISSPSIAELEAAENYWDVLKWPMVPKTLGVIGEDDPKKPRSCLSRAFTDWDKFWKPRLWYIFTFPINLVFRFTIPDCTYDVFREDKEGKDENRRLGFSLTFFMCVVWIAFLSHLLVYCTTALGCLVGLSAAVMGLTLLAAGTSVPDALSSVIVAKNGQGDMAVANSIGSNVFDILIGLGLPWFIAGLAFDDAVKVDNSDLWGGLGFLFGVLIILIVSLLMTKWMLHAKMGCVLLVLYLVYVVFELALRP